jgi:hypothetical protein
VKRCRKCGQTRALDDFYRADGGRDGHRTECKDCSLKQRKQWYRDNRERSIAYVKSWQEANPERVRASAQRNRSKKLKKMRELHLRRNFGLSIDEYERLLEQQGGGCAICQSPPTPGISLHVDHDHGSGEIRGLLCFRCNNGIGLFRENPDLLQDAARYVVTDPKLRSRRDEWAELARERVRALGRSAA